MKKVKSTSKETQLTGLSSYDMIRENLNPPIFRRHPKWGDLSTRSYFAQRKVVSANSNTKAEVMTLDHMK